MKRRHFLCSLGALLISDPVAAQGVSDQSAAAAEWLNAFRTSAGADPLSVSPVLSKTAADHVNDMTKKGFFSHTGSDGSNIGDRLRRRGYGFCYASENIAKGQHSLEQVLTGWANSKGHRRNMLSKQAQEFGLILGPDRIWVMVLGRAGC